MKKYLPLILLTLFVPSITWGLTTLITPQGGTGRSSFPAATLLVGNGTGALQATTSPTIGYFTATSTTASSTAQNGINLAGGCFAIGGTCLTGTTYTATYPVTLTGTAFGLAFGTTTNNTWSGINTFTGQLGASSTALFTSGFTAYASSTLQAFTAPTGSITSLTIPGIINSLLSTNSAGLVVASSTIGNNQLQNSTISGISLGGTLAALTATDGTLTFSGSYTGGTARTVGLNLGNANVWTAGQQFNASTTLQNFTAQNATTTNATTTNLTVSGNTILSTLTSALLLTGANGFVAEYAGTSCTNQVATALSALGVATCSSINNDYWSGTDLSVANGGSGASSLTGLLQGNGTSAFTAISDSSTVGQILRVTGASTYAWGALDLADSDAVTGALPIANGGTNATSFIARTLAFFDGTRLVSTSTNPLYIGSISATSTATSTFVGGVNLTGITGQCYAVRGVCVSRFAAMASSTAGTNATIVFTGAFDSVPSFSGNNLTLPANTAYFTVELWGGGGGGAGGGNDAASYAGGGGGGGGYSQKTFRAPIAATYYYTIGAGGAGSVKGASGGAAGAAGGTSCFGTNSTACTTPTITAVGGSGGGGTGLSAEANGGGTGGDINLVGSGGGTSAGFPNGGNSPYVGGGVGGPAARGSGGGAGGSTGYSSGSLGDGFDGSIPGGGGGGGGNQNSSSATATGGDGAVGGILISAYTY